MTSASNADHTADRSAPTFSFMPAPGTAWPAPGRFREHQPVCHAASPPLASQWSGSFAPRRAALRPFEPAAARAAPTICDCTELAAFLRACRARLAPVDVGLPDGSASGRRRTPGLRREEVAQLSGVGVTWYTRLEQGRDIAASAQVVDALARALLLTGDQHRHLREPAGLPPPQNKDPDVAGASEALPRLQLLVDAVMPSPASIYDVEHPEAGLIALEMFQLRLIDRPDLVMVVQVPAGGAHVERISALLQTPDGRLADPRGTVAADG